MKSIGIFCGSSTGYNKIYGDTSFELGVYLARKKIRIIFGGGQIGLMGKLADGALSEGGEVIGVIPYFLQQKELGHTGVSKLIKVESMHSRKFEIYEMSDAFVAMPGGFGTLDELFEIITWGQLGLHRKPVAILNINGFFNHLLGQLNLMVAEGFLKKENRELVLSSETIEDLYNEILNFKPVLTSKWIENDKL